MEKITIGLIGYGTIAKVHCLGYKTIPIFYNLSNWEVELYGVAASSEHSLSNAKSQLGLIKTTTDYHELISDPHISVIDCSAPNYLHYDIIMAAIKAGKHVYCEKPAGLNVAESLMLYEAAKSSGIKHQVAFQTRFIPAIIHAKKLISQGFLGEIIQLRGHYLHSSYLDPDKPMTWRQTEGQSGGGALIDLGSHLIDLIHFLAGDFATVTASTRTLITQRVRPSGELEKITVDDIATAQFTLQNGAIGLFEVSRVATGKQEDLSLEIHGTCGSIAFSLEDPGHLKIYDNNHRASSRDEEKGIQLLDTQQHYAAATIPSPKAPIGWTRFHVASQYHFLHSLVHNTQPEPSFKTAVKVHSVIETMYRSAQLGVSQNISYPC